MGGPDISSTNGAEHATSSSDSSTTASQDDQPPIAEPPDIVAAIEKPSFPHTLPIERVAHQFETDIDDGLTGDEAAARLVRDGSNTIKGAKGLSLWEILLQQILNALTAVLIAVAVLSFAIKDYIEAAVVVAVIVLNIVVG